MNGFCAKGGHPKEPHHLNYVCGEHVNTAGFYTHCSECGGPLHADGRADRGWKHNNCTEAAS